jgi:hypothetical protein
MFRKALVAVLLVVLPGFAHAQSAFPDLHDYQALLDQYVIRINAKDQPLDTRFEYEQLYVDEKIWTLHRSERLAELHARLTAAKPSQMTPTERLAWGIDTYNFLVIERVTLHLLRPGHKFQRYKSVDQMGTREGRFFQGYVAKIEGRDYTLEQFERVFVQGDTTPVSLARKPLQDPRVLFAVNPGYIGAPPLQPRAFRPDSLDRQLDQAVRTAIALPRFVTVQERPADLVVSSWLGRNLPDFGGVPGMFAFIRKYAPRSLVQSLNKTKLTDVSRYAEVNVLLNQKDHPKVVMPTPAEGDTVSP